jgi:hypothetical protein
MLQRREIAPTVAFVTLWKPARRRRPTIHFDALRGRAAALNRTVQVKSIRWSEFGLG